MLNESISNKKILITGASGGIGMYLAIHIAHQGGVPILAARSEDRLKVISEHITRRYDVPCPWYKADLTDMEAWRNTIAHILEDVGLIDAVINNAGTGLFQHFSDMSQADIDRMLATNLASLMHTTHQLLPQFLARRRGHIINIASQAGKMATPKAAVYSATKHGVLGFTNALRLEAEPHGVFVTAVNLGPVKTRFFKTADPAGHYESTVASMMLEPNHVAQKIVQHLFTKQREINLPRWMNAGSTLYQLVPGVVEKIMAPQFYKK
ncbi:SDR family oxidoreductase [Thalassobacillus sp. CUG 92003]|uniref:SDR family NAD(P)-dependent oxidoreductase n=1 Tax=Thalassobacillus sp. CUG 92003 TaxID=2736641 RepID=UPI002103BE3B|nr:SDR family oxidoreductase [Thalassobacillus sp. CUG 92003]